MKGRREEDRLERMQGEGREGDGKGLGRDAR